VETHNWCIFNAFGVAASEPSVAHTALRCIGGPNLARSSCLVVGRLGCANSATPAPTSVEHRNIDPTKQTSDAGALQRFLKTKF
jgi:hypothetical protein